MREAMISARRRSGVLCALFIACSWIGAASGARADPVAGAALATKGDPASGAPACATCHGAAGAGMASVAPRLAGLSKQYILAQLSAFQTGTRKNSIMQPVAAALSPTQAEDLADYFSAAQAPSHPVAAAADLMKAGQGLAERGRWSEGLPACDQCHAPHGVGVVPSFPYLAGQQADYLEQRIRAFRDGATEGDTLGLMRAVARKLRDEDISAVSAYYASFAAPPRQGGN